MLRGSPTYSSSSCRRALSSGTRRGPEPDATSDGADSELQPTRASRRDRSTTSTDRQLPVTLIQRWSPVRCDPVILLVRVTASPQPTARVTCRDDLPAEGPGGQNGGPCPQTPGYPDAKAIDASEEARVR